MLSLQEAKWALSAYKIFSTLNVFPIEVDVESGKIKRQSNRVKVLIWKILFGVGVSHWFYMFARLIQSTVIDREKYFRWDHFVFHFGLTLGSGVFNYTGFCLFGKNAEESLLIFNQLFVEREDPLQKLVQRELQIQMESKSGNKIKGKTTRGKSGTRIVLTSAREKHEQVQSQNQVVENQAQSQARSRPLLTWPPKYSLDELLAKFLPVIAVATGFFLIFILAIDPNRPQLLFSSLPPKYQNVWSFLALLAVEALWIAFMTFTAGFALVVQVLVFQKCQLEFQRMSLQLRNLEEKFQNGTFGVRHIAKEIWILRQILEEMRELVVLIELFNRCFPFCIFAWKLCSLGICIMFYFFVIRHFHEFPFLGLFITYAAIIMTFIYTVIYGHAFSIPGEMDELKKEFLLTAQNTASNSNTAFLAVAKKEIKRIRGVGIKVGNFNQMERESTPAFVDFVLRNVVTLLVTFKR